MLISGKHQTRSYNLQGGYVTTIRTLGRKTRGAGLREKTTPLNLALKELGITPLSDEAVNDYKDALYRNALEASPRHIRMFAACPVVARLIRAMFTCLFAVAIGATVIGFIRMIVPTVTTLLLHGISALSREELMALPTFLGCGTMVILFTAFMGVIFEEIERQVYGMIWQVRDLSDSMHPWIPEPVVNMAVGLRRALGEDNVRLEIHEQGPDPFIRATYYPGNGYTDSAFICGFLGGAKQYQLLTEVNGRIVEGPEIIVSP